MTKKNPTSSFWRSLETGDADLQIYRKFSQGENFFKILIQQSLYSIFEKKSMVTYSLATRWENILQQNERCLLRVAASSFETNSGLSSYDFFFTKLQQFEYLLLTSFYLKIFHTKNKKISRVWRKVDAMSRKFRISRIS